MTEKDGTTRRTESDDRKLDPEVLYQKARGSTFELLKLLVALSTTGVGAYFVVLTRSQSGLTNADKPWALYALGCMALATFTGISGWGFDARYYARWADYLTDRDLEAKQDKESSRKLRRRLIGASAVFFALGIFLSGILAANHL
jgi:hypothetical protein